jgi:hypothetical protein
MLKVNNLVTCAHFIGDAYLASGEGVNADRRKYTCHIPCLMCEGSGNPPRPRYRESIRLVHAKLTANILLLLKTGGTRSAPTRKGGYIPPTKRQF